MAKDLADYFGMNACFKHSRGDRVAQVM
jgi:hypothetical protein